VAAGARVPSGAGVDGPPAPADEIPPDAAPLGPGWFGVLVVHPATSSSATPTVVAASAARMRIAAPRPSSNGLPVAPDRIAAPHVGRPRLQTMRPRHLLRQRVMRTG